MNGAQMEAAGERLIEFFRVMNDTCSCSAERITRPDAKRESELLSRFFAFSKAFSCGLGSHRNAQLFHQLPKPLSVLSDFNSIDIHANHPNTIFFPKPHLIALDAKVQSGLPSHGRQH